MKTQHPRSQTTNEIVDTLFKNTKSQYTESAHAEIFNRLITTISDFNQKAERAERIVLILAVAQVLLACAQILLAFK